MDLLAFAVGFACLVFGIAAAACVLACVGACDDDCDGRNP